MYTSTGGGHESLWVMNADGSDKRPFLPEPVPAADAEAG